MSDKDKPLEEETEKMNENSKSAEAKENPEDEGVEVDVEVKGDKEDIKKEILAEEDEEEILKKELAEKEDKYLRLAAEFDNYKKRTAREFGHLIQTANRDLIVQLLEILDNFERAFSADHKDQDKESFLKGMHLIYSQFEKILKEQGLEEIKTEGEEFDPELHEAVMAVETDDFKEDHVVEVLQKGYKLKDNVIRHSRVSVAKPKSKN